MRSFKKSAVRSDIGARSHAQPADKPGAKIRDNITIEVRQNKHIIKLGLLYELHAHIVHDAVFELNLGIFFSHFARHFKEKTVREFHDIGLVNGRHFLAFVLTRVVKGKFHDSFGAGHGDRFDADAGILTDLVFGKFLNLRDKFQDLRSALLELDPGVKVFGILAHDHEIDILIAGPHAFIGFAGPEAGVEIELFAERDIHGAESRSHWRGDWRLDGDLVLADGFDHAVRKRRAFARHHIQSCGLDIPIEFDARGFQTFFCGFRELRADPVARNQSNTVGFHVYSVRDRKRFLKRFRGWLKIE